MSTAKVLHEERIKAVAELRALCDEAEGREFTADEVEKRDQLDAAIVSLEGRLTAALTDQEREARSAEFAAAIEASTPEVRDESADSEERQWSSLVNQESRFIELRGSDAEVRDLTVGTAGDGAELVATTTFGEIYGYMRENANAVGQNARQVITADGGDMTFEVVSSYSTASIVNEAAAIPESDPQFGTVTLGAYKVGFMVQVSSELEQDSVAAVQSFVTSQGREALTRGIGNYFVNGTGTSQPNGALNTTNSKNVSFAGAAAITGDELHTLKHGIASPYRQNAVWIMNDSTVELIRKLKNTDGQYLWQPGLHLGVPDTLLGRPVVTDDAMPEATTGNASVLFGDFGRGYLARTVNGVRVERSTEYAFANDLVSYRFLVRVDGGIIDNNAIVKGTQA